MRIGIGVTVLALALPAAAAKFRTSKATDEELVAQLGLEGPEVRLEIVAELGERGLVSSCPVLTQRVKTDDHQGVRSLALDTLEAMSCPELLHAAQTAVRSDPTPSNRMQALDLARRQGDPQQLQLYADVLAHDTAAQVRHRALGLAIETRLPGVEALYREALRDDYSEVVRDAALELVLLQDEEARQALFEEVPTLRALDREVVMEAWKGRPLHGDTGYLLACLDDSHLPVALAAAAALATLGDPKALPALRTQAQRERDKDVRKALERTIETLEDGP